MNEVSGFEEFLYVFGVFEEVSSIFVRGSRFAKEMEYLIAEKEVKRDNVFEPHQKEKEGHLK